MRAHARRSDADKQLWGGETAKAVENFPISGETVPVSVIHWLARIKGAAAAVNGELGLLPKRSAARIEKAAAEIAAGKHDAQFPIDVFQTGSGTSTNTNANEVIARLAGERIHPNDHVNMGQSSNDVFPSAVQLAALDVAQNELLPALRELERSLARKARSFQNIVKAGRTHLMDAVPVTLGQEFAGYAAQIALAQERVGVGARARRPDPARRHRDRHRAEHPSALRRARARAPEARIRAAPDRGAAGPLRGAGQPRRARRALRRAQGASPSRSRRSPATSR